MRKAYATDIRDLPGAVAGSKVNVEGFFTLNPEHAYLWPTREHALQASRNFDSYNIHVSWAEGGDYLCKDFEMDECSPREFDVFCEGPFTLTV